MSSPKDEETEASSDVPPAPTYPGYWTLSTCTLAGFFHGDKFQELQVHVFRKFGVILAGSGGLYGDATALSGAGGFPGVCWGLPEPLFTSSGPTPTAPLDLARGLAIQSSNPVQACWAPPIPPRLGARARRLPGTNGRD